MIDTQDLPARSRRQGRFDLAIPAAQAFDLFTAEGERQWVAGWDPVIFSACGALSPGAVFLTDHGGESTIWTVIAADRVAGRLHYSRVSPGRRAGTVEVTIAPAKSGSTVHVAYDMTALGPDGEAVVEAMNEPAFTAMLGEWKHRIEAAVIDPSGAVPERELAR